MKERLSQFGIMKGIAMLSVIVGHIFMPQLFFMYHVPLFFFVSGFFFKKKPFMDCLSSNGKQLLLPYIKCGGIILLCYFLFYGYEYACIYGYDLILGTSVSNNLRVFIGPLWFLLTLFWVRIIYNIFDRPFLIVPVSFILSGLCAYIGDDFNWLSIPGMMVQSIPALFFFAIGHACKLYNCLQCKIGKLDLLIPIIIALLVFSIFQIKETTMNISMMRLTFFPYSFLNSLMWIYLFWRISLIIKQYYVWSVFLKYCGEKTLDFLLCHSVAFCFLLPPFGKYMGTLDTKMSALLFLGFNIFFNIAICYGYAYLKTRILSRIKI